MRIRTARRVLKKWSAGLGHYTDNRYGTVLCAAEKVVSYEARRGRTSPAIGGGLVIYRDYAEFRGKNPG